MKKLLAIILLFSMTQGVSACASKSPELKSPCVGIAGSPCDRKKVNDWWMHA